MTVIEYLNKIFVELTNDEASNIDEPILSYKDAHYLEIETFFRINYHINIVHPYVLYGDETYLTFYVTNKVTAELLYDIATGIILCPTLIGDNENEAPSIPAIKCSMIIDC